MTERKLYIHMKYLHGNINYFLKESYQGKSKKILDLRMSKRKLKKLELRRYFS